MKILKVDKDKVQVELTANEMAEIEAGLLARSQEVTRSIIYSFPGELVAHKFFQEWEQLRDNMRNA